MKPQIKTLRPKYEAPVITGFDLSLEADICTPASYAQTQEFKIDDSWMWDDELVNE